MLAPSDVHARLTELREEVARRALARQAAQSRARLDAAGIANPESILRWCPHVPSAKQIEFLAARQLEVGYGGGAGGGKTDGGLMKAAQYLDCPGWSVLILRRTFAMLSQPGGLIPRTREWWANTGAIYNETQRQWRFPSGAVIKFGYLDGDADVYNYQGAEYNLVWFEEATQFPNPRSYEYLLSRMRRPEGSQLPLQMILTCNPGGIGEPWVRQRFIESNDPDRTFVRALLEDNPGLDKASYRKQLEKLDHVTRAQLLDGAWGLSHSAGMFKHEWFRLCDTAPPRLSRHVWAWDLAASESETADYTCGVLMALNNDAPKGTVEHVIVDVWRGRWTAEAVRTKIRAATQMAPPGTLFVYPQDPGQAGKDQAERAARELFKGVPYRIVKPTKSKIERALPLAAAAERGEITVVRSSWLNEYISELTAFPEGLHDDQVDPTVDAYAILTEQQTKSLTIGVHRGNILSARRFL